jgi:tetratricopeptide (TPR) repeat protein
MRGHYPFRWFAVLALSAALPAASRAQLAFTAGSTATSDSSNHIPELAEPTQLPAPHLTLEQLGDIDYAKQHYQAAIELYSRVERPSAVLWNKMGIAYQMMNALTNAIRCYEEALKLTPGDASILNNLGTAEDGLGDYPAGERAYRKALERDPDFAMLLKNLGTNLLMQHKYEKGAEAYRRALALDPHIFDAHSALTVKDPAPRKERGTAAYFKARSCARAQLDDCALAYLRTAFNQGSATAQKVNKEADFARLRATPAYAQLLSLVE